MHFLWIAALASDVIAQQQSKLTVDTAKNRDLFVPFLLDHKQLRVARWSDTSSPSARRSMDTCE